MKKIALIATSVVRWPFHDAGDSAPKELGFGVLAKVAKPHRYVALFEEESLADIVQRITFRYTAVADATVETFSGDTPTKIWMSAEASGYGGFEFIPLGEIHGYECYAVHQLEIRDLDAGGSMVTKHWFGITDLAGAGEPITYHAKDNIRFGEWSAGESELVVAMTLKARQLIPVDKEKPT